MRILIAANNDVGLFKFRRELIERLLGSNEVYLSLPKGEYIGQFMEMGCRFSGCDFDRHGTNPIKELQQVKYYRRLLQEIRPDIVLTYTIKPNVYCGAACAGFGIPYVVNVTGLGTALENGGAMQMMTLALYRYGLRKAQKVFFQNADNRDFMLAKGAVRTPFDMLPGSGVNLQQYQPLPYPNDGTIHFAFISRIMKEKGVDQYLDAAAEIRKRHPETRFHVCGSLEPEYKGRLQELTDNKTVIYHGLVSDITEIHRISSCTIHPTYYPEGMSNVLLESCACGRPIITTDRPGCREILEDGGNGFLVKQKSTEDLVMQIEKFLALPWDKRRQMGLAGRAKVEKEFDRNIVIAKYLEEINQCR